ncbi:DUF2889 domain-containing protein [Paraburkholderia sp. J76]|uniref:DUF2889 domain-containing protein n=1 Tax=Paraburkholderia sp. J76 TaxID=2805439 RepID=UPI002ABDAC24|nr:DUF2889 domain-containing protein [Paraburkholderia sp. J76]
MNDTTETRRLLHTRKVLCEAFQRSDGRFEIEGRMQDITPGGTDLILKIIPPGAHLHDMRMVMTLDADLVIQDISARIEASPTVFCHEIESAYAGLVGIRIGPGFRQQVKARVGGIKGCTHLTELLGPMATTAMQAHFAIQRASPQWRARLEGDAPLAAPPFIDSCHTHRANGDAAKIYWPERRRQRERIDAAS